MATHSQFEGFVGAVVLKAFLKLQFLVWSYCLSHIEINFAFVVPISKYVVIRCVHLKVFFYLIFLVTSFSVTWPVCYLVILITVIHGETGSALVFGESLANFTF